ncbi:MAG: dihydrodipicolinate synthase family protein [Caldilineaceae bacterium]
MTTIVVDQVNGRVPVVINTGAPGTDLAVLYSRRAEELGADALMILPPSFMPATGSLKSWTTSARFPMRSTSRSFCKTRQPRPFPPVWRAS